MSIVNKKAVCNLGGKDGNAFVLMAHWESCAKESGFTSSEIVKVLDECMEKDYNHLLKTLQDHCEG